MNPAPDVSVVIPVFNRPDSLRRSVVSALAQSIPGDLEVVVVDDASIVPIGWEGDERVRILRHSANRGAAEARNTGMREARGEFIAFLDSDDIWEQGKLANQLHVLRAGPPELIGAFTTYAFETAPARRIGAPAGVIDWFAYFLDGCRAGPGSTLMFRRNRYVTIGDQDPRLQRFEDWDWLLRAARLGRFALVPGAGALLTLSGRPSFATVLSCTERMDEKWRDRLNSAELRQLRAALDIERAAAAHWNGDRFAMARYLGQALLRNPAVVAREIVHRLSQRR